MKARISGADRPHPRELAAAVVDRVLAFAPGSPRLVFRVEKSTLDRDLIALSFDDGPSPHNTNAVLDLLSHHDARATFFVVGERIRGNEEVIQRIAAERHELANHTYSHVHTVHLDRSAVRREIELGNRAIEQAAGVEPRLVRPPFGKDRRRIAQESQALGMTAAMWSLDSRDAMHASKEEIADLVVAGAERGSIVLFHDGGGPRPATLWGLERALAQLSSRGFEFVTVSELLSGSRS